MERWDVLVSLQGLPWMEELWFKSSHRHQWLESEGAVVRKSVGSQVWWDGEEPN
jgi:hypothetical protein